MNTVRRGNCEVRAWHGAPAYQTLVLCIIPSLIAHVPFLSYTLLHLSSQGAPICYSFWQAIRKDLEPQVPEILMTQTGAGLLGCVCSLLDLLIYSSPCPFRCEYPWGEAAAMAWGLSWCALGSGSHWGWWWCGFLRRKLSWCPGCLGQLARTLPMVLAITPG